MGPNIVKRGTLGERAGERARGRDESVVNLRVDLASRIQAGPQPRATENATSVIADAT
jgi:hypothetical protein